MYALTALAESGAGKRLEERQQFRHVPAHRPMGSSTQSSCRRARVEGFVASERDLRYDLWTKSRLSLLFGPYFFLTIEEIANTIADSNRLSVVAEFFRDTDN
jgi:hypothetical protein